MSQTLRIMLVDDHAVVRMGFRLLLDTTSDLRVVGLTKRSAADALIEAIRQVAAGKLFLEPALAQEIGVEQVGSQGNPLEALSAREFEVFVMLARGKSVAEIAEVLFLSPRTVGTHLYNIKQKLGAGNSAELTLIAIRNGLIDA